MNQSTTVTLPPFATDRPILSVSDVPLPSAQRALDNLFSSLSPEQVQNFLQEINAPESNMRTVNHDLTGKTPSPATTPHDISQSLAMTRRSCRAVRRHCGHNRGVSETGRLRPLNSFIAFRSYYSPMFPSLLQKVKSGLLREIWKMDPFKAKWTILAKAYSKVRDSHSDQVSLDTFLSLSGPLIGIVPPKDYLVAMGLQLSKEAEKGYQISKQSGMKTPSQSELTTNLSVDDIVSYCYESGYISGKLARNDEEFHGIGVAMAVTAQTTKQSCPRLRNNSAERIERSRQIRDATEGRSRQQGRMLRKTATTGTQITPQFITGDLTIILEDGGRKTQQAFQADAPYTAAEFDEELRNAVNTFQVEGDPYYSLFSPSVQAPVVLYNPYEIQGDFDAFEIAGYIPM